MNNKKRVLILSIIGVIIVTIGITYAVFTYTKLGTTDNTATTGTLKFLYTENTGVKTGIKLTNALPISDAQGKALDGDNNVFDFSIEATNTGTEVIPYEVTLRKKDTSTLAEENVKVYLTDRSESQESSILEPINFNKLIQTNIDVGSEIEKTIYSGSYYCEQAKAQVSPNNSQILSGNAVMTVVGSKYVPDFKCTTDGNGKGLVDTSIGMITYDEILFSGGYHSTTINSFIYMQI